MPRACLLVALLFTACQRPAPEPPVVPAPRPAPTVVRTAPSPGELTAMPLDKLFTRQQTGSVLIYDARPAFVSSFGAIPGAISWPRRDFKRGLPQHEEEIRAAESAGTPVVIYCTDADCPDAKTVAKQLVALGHDVSVLEGGFAEWKGAGLPVE
ncbi:rhodanese-like domain-containing protein [Luteolibacter marinus]|uniref:rhodanese-like domain-containing protein n=1 Tax=Luteolibacter marinus TaxID=2776705 RepID=UPI0018695BE4|nr:rhodanese-like domain-containing protein [Luteolibacter marinus]